MTNNKPRRGSRRSEFWTRPGEEGGGRDGGRGGGGSCKRAQTPSKFASKWQLISVRMNGPAPLICHFAPRDNLFPTVNIVHSSLPSSTQIYIYVCMYVWIRVDKTRGKMFWRFEIFWILRWRRKILEGTMTREISRKFLNGFEMVFGCMYVCMYVYSVRVLEREFAREESWKDVLR